MVANLQLSLVSRPGGYHLKEGLSFWYNFIIIYILTAGLILLHIIIAIKFCLVSYYYKNAGLS